MLVLWLGLVGFGVLFLYDLASLRQLRGCFLIAALGYGMQGAAILLAACAREKFLLPTGLVWCGWLLVLLGGSWLFYCLFLSPPIFRSYFTAGPPVLTKEGPYAFSRHPGVWGYLFFVEGLAFVTQSSLLFESGLIWFMADLLYVLIQDRWVFPSLFSDYREYARETPMIFPTARSLRCFWETTFCQKRGGA